MIRKTISVHDGLIPKGYRVSWVKAHTNEYVCYPLGLHWIMNKLYGWWVRSFRYNPSDLEIREMKLYRQGYADGKVGRDEKFNLFESQLQDYYQEETMNDKD